MFGGKNDWKGMKKGGGSYDFFSMDVFPQTDPEKMLLCDGCDRGHHIFCLKPKLKSIPKDDWFCSDCKPKERIRSPKKKVFF